MAACGVAAERWAAYQRVTTVSMTAIERNIVGYGGKPSESLRLAGHSLQRARDVAQTGQEELVAAEVRVALDELGKVVGAVYTDDLLDRIFSRFCIGK